MFVPVFCALPSKGITVGWGSWPPEVLSLAPDLLLSSTELVVFVLTLGFLIKRDVSHVSQSRRYSVSSVMLTFTLLPPLWRAAR